ncbi:hypothetical protein [Sinomonas terrae]|uniref:SCP2 domain-containing protein n=1 Tax=Sinomonas terrae TaxID=2908838 RepID=A0ABS9U6Y8_9MICC|nr:hypothetical protein [Sinomonas terrae]MCH6472444.1 hypothetical protein [Sinomonas terrae]
MTKSGRITLGVIGASPAPRRSLPSPARPGGPRASPKRSTAGRALSSSARLPRTTAPDPPWARPRRASCSRGTSRPIQASSPPQCTDDDGAPLRELARLAEAVLEVPSGTDLTAAVLDVLVTDAAPASLRLRILTDDGGLTAVVPCPDTAAPAEVRFVGPDGERLLPTPWETARRASWRRAVAIAAGEALSGDLAGLHRVTPLAAAALG